VCLRFGSDLAAQFDHQHHREKARNQQASQVCDKIHKRHAYGYRKAFLAKKAFARPAKN
jgi:hypothetical protein